MSAHATQRGTAAAVLLVPALSGCNPVVEISGAFFPAWLLCMIVGVAVAGAIRWFAVRFNVESFVGPKSVFYFSTWLAGTLGMWLLFYSR